LLCYRCNKVKRHHPISLVELRRRIG
jgi:hypothetical protein